MSVYRKYLLLCALTFWGWGISFFIDQKRWDTAPSFVSMNEILPLWLWGTITVALAIGFSVVFYTSAGKTTKTSAMNLLAGCAATVTSIWFFDYLFVTLFGERNLSPMLPGAFFYLTSVHMIVIQSPMKDPALDEIKEALKPDSNDVDSVL